MLIGGKSCHSCDHRYKMGGNVFCTRYPPQAYLAPGPRGQPMLQASYPPVNPAIPCGEHRRNEAFAQAEIDDQSAIEAAAGAQVRKLSS